MGSSLRPLAIRSLRGSDVSLPIGETCRLAPRWDRVGQRGRRDLVGHLSRRGSGRPNPRAGHGAERGQATSPGIRPPCRSLPNSRTTCRASGSLSGSCVKDPVSRIPSRQRTANQQLKGPTAVPGDQSSHVQLRDSRGGMNPRPLGYEPSELPNCSTPRPPKTAATDRRAEFPEPKARWPPPRSDTPVTRAWTAWRRPQRLFTPASALAVLTCRQHPFQGAWCRPVTANLTDERRTNDQGPDRCGQRSGP
jgi:hypothetical protein